MMKHTCLPRLLSLCITFTLLSATATINAAYAAQDDPNTEISQNPQTSTPDSLSGRITDVITASGITYIEVQTGKEKVWAAGTTDDSLGEGDTISFSTAMPMQNFHSKSLNRDFPVIYFVKQFTTTNPASNRDAAPPTARTPGEVVTGKLLRDASLDGLNTEDKPLSDYKGKPLIINVWASWCGPCRAEMGSLERLAKRFNGKQLNIIGVSTDDYRDKATAFIDQEAVSFANYIDHQLLLENMLGASTIPLTVLVDADGRVLMKVRGSREWDSPEILDAIGDVFQMKLM